MIVFPKPAERSSMPQNIPLVRESQVFNIVFETVFKTNI